jgi:hypothetical protein
MTSWRSQPICSAGAGPAKNTGRWRPTASASGPAPAARVGQLDVERGGAATTPARPGAAALAREQLRADGEPVQTGNERNAAEGSCRLGSDRRQGRRSLREYPPEPRPPAGGAEPQDPLRQRRRPAAAGEKAHAGSGHGRRVGGDANVVWRRGGEGRAGQEAGQVMTVGRLQPVGPGSSQTIGRGNES